MKKFIVIALCLFAVGCSSTYLITTKDGETITSLGKPTLDKETNMLRFEDENGRMRQLPHNEVKQIMER